jgi:hypothetical protein
MPYSWEGVKGWDLTPAAFIEYFNLYKKYEKIKKDYSIELTLWKTDEVFGKVLKNF